MTPTTNWTASTTRWATYGGPNAAIFTASSMPWRGRRSIRSHSSQESSPFRTLRLCTSNSARGARYEGLVSSSSTTRRQRHLMTVTTPADAPRPCRPGRQPHMSAPHVAARSAVTGTALCGSGSSAPATMPRRCCSPTSRRKPGSTLARVSTRRSLSAVNAQRKFGFQDASTDTNALLEDPSIDAVFIVTRHSAHADLTCQALEAGKAVFVEKPLALTVRGAGSHPRNGRSDRERQDHGRLQSSLRPTAGRHAQTIRSIYLSRRAPRYLVNAGRLASDSWYRNVELEGSRFVGEGGHFVDTAELVDRQRSGGSHDTAGRRERGDAGEPSLRRRIPGDHHLPDGSTPTLSQGDLRGIERWANRSTRTISNGPPFGRAHTPASGAISVATDKGQRAQIAAFLSSLRIGGPMPISLESLTATTRATLAAAAAAHTSNPSEAVTLPFSRRTHVDGAPDDEPGRTRMALPATVTDVRDRGGLADLRPFQAQTVGEPSRSGPRLHRRAGRCALRATPRVRGVVIGIAVSGLAAEEAVGGRSRRCPPEGDHGGRASCWRGGGTFSVPCAGTWRIRTGFLIR